MGTSFLQSWNLQTETHFTLGFGFGFGFGFGQMREKRMFCLNVFFLGG